MSNEKGPSGKQTLNEAKANNFCQSVQKKQTRKKTRSLMTCQIMKQKNAFEMHGYGLVRKKLHIQDT